MLDGGGAIRRQPTRRFTIRQRELSAEAIRGSAGGYLLGSVSPEMARRTDLVGQGHAPRLTGDMAMAVMHSVRPWISSPVRRLSSGSPPAPPSPRPPEAGRRGAGGAGPALAEFDVICVHWPLAHALGQPSEGMAITDRWPASGRLSSKVTTTWALLRINRISPNKISQKTLSVLDKPDTLSLRSAPHQTEPLAEGPTYSRCQPSTAGNVLAGTN